MKALSFTIALALVLTLPAAARAQNREPLCVPVRATRLAHAVSSVADPSVQMTAATLSGTHGEPTRLLVAARNHDGLFAPSEGSESQTTNARPGTVILRMGDDLRAGQAASYLADPADMDASAPATVASVSLPSGVLLIANLGRDLRATIVPLTGNTPVWRSVVAAPEPLTATTPRRFEWVTATRRNNGAVVLAGTPDGAVFAVRFGPDGASGSPVRWEQRVGGPLQLLPLPDGPLAALLGRPIQGNGSHGEIARQQLLVTIDDNLRPVGQPEATGFAQFPMSFIERGHYLSVFQWAGQQGVAIANLPVGEHRVGEQLPRIWRAEPALEGEGLGQAATIGTGVIYDVVFYAESNAAIRGHIAWVPPEGTPILRRDVLSLRARMLDAPAVIPAADGVVAVVAVEDETGVAVDAYHLHCDLVTVPAGQ